MNRYIHTIFKYKKALVLILVALSSLSIVTLVVSKVYAATTPGGGSGASSILSTIPADINGDLKQYNDSTGGNDNCWGSPSSNPAIYSWAYQTPDGSISNDSTITISSPSTTSVYINMAILGFQCKKDITPVDTSASDTSGNDCSYDYDLPGSGDPNPSNGEYCNGQGLKSGTDPQEIEYYIKDVTVPSVNAKVVQVGDTTITLSPNSSSRVWEQTGGTIGITPNNNTWINNESITVGVHDVGIVQKPKGYYCVVHSPDVPQPIDTATHAFQKCNETYQPFTFTVNIPQVTVGGNVYYYNSVTKKNTGAAEHVTVGYSCPGSIPDDTTSTGGAGNFNVSLDEGSPFCVELPSSDKALDNATAEITPNSTSGPPVGECNGDTSSYISQTAETDSPDYSAGDCNYNLGSNLDYDIAIVSSSSSSGGGCTSNCGGTGGTSTNCPGVNGAGNTNTQPTVTLTSLATTSAPSGTPSKGDSYDQITSTGDFTIVSAKDQYSTSVTWGTSTTNDTQDTNPVPSTVTLNYANYVTNDPYDPHDTTVTYTETYNETIWEAVGNDQTTTSYVCPASPSGYWTLSGQTCNGAATETNGGSCTIRGGNPVVRQLTLVLTVVMLLKLRVVSILASRQLQKRQVQRQLTLGNRGHLKMVLPALR